MSGQMPIRHQYFDGADTSLSNSIIIKLDTASTNIWQIGRPHKTIFHAASTLPKVIVTDTSNYYPNKNISRFSFYTTGYFSTQIFALRWKQKLDMDKKKDGAIVEFSTNSGQSWNNTLNNSNVYQFYGFNQLNKDTLTTGEFALSGRDSTWRDMWLCLSPTVLSLNDTLYFRYTFKSDSINTNKEGWMIDNFIAQTTVVHPVKSISAPQPIAVYPTNTSGILNIELQIHTKGNAILNVEVIGSDGKILERIAPNNLKTILDISNQLPGTYIIRVTTNSNVMSFPIILEKN